MAVYDRVNLSDVTERTVALLVRQQANCRTFYFTRLKTMSLIKQFQENRVVRIQNIE